MAEEITESTIQKALDFAYDKAVNGITGLDSAIDLAESYKNSNDDLLEKCNSLIRWQNIKAGTTGFTTGLGGLLLMPLTLPANITSILYIQIRMIAAIAHLGGHDLKDDKVKTFVYVCLVGESVVGTVVKNISQEVVKKVATNTIKSISGKTLQQINKQVQFKLFTKFGEKGVINLGKAVPILGGIIGGLVDSVSTNITGNLAIKTFIDNK